MDYEQEEELAGAGFRITDGGDDDDLMEPLEDIPDFGGDDDSDDKFDKDH